MAEYLEPQQSDEKIMRWTDLKIDQTGDLLPRLEAMDPLYKFAPENTVLESCPLSFYPDAELLRLTLMSWPSTEDALWYVFLKDSNQITNLDGDIATIHQLNIDAPLHLTAKNIIDYLKFRLFFEMREGYRLFVISNGDELGLAGSEELADINALLSEPVLHPDHKQAFKVGLCYHHHENLYQAMFEIDSRGLTTELDRTGLPVTVQLPTAPVLTFD